jgi:hypothetical protein
MKVRQDREEKSCNSQLFRIFKDGHLQDCKHASQSLHVPLKKSVMSIRERKIHT